MPCYNMAEWDTRTPGYETAYRASIREPGTFWGSAAAEVIWEKAWDSVLDESNAPFYQ
jgi:propionyl-CoA synthetase